VEQPGRFQEAENLGVHKDIRYAEIPGVDPKLTSLDLYSIDSGGPRPVAIFVHGGGWANGDKGGLVNLPGVFAREGYVLVSINYRLSPAAQFPAHAEDVASAVAWTKQNVAGYGGDPGRIFLTGHSAGAHLVALVATDERYLLRHGIRLSDIRAVAPNDTLMYDIPLVAKRFGGTLPRVYAVPFSQDPEFWKFASPSCHVERGKGIPPMMIAYSGGLRAHGNLERVATAEAFAGTLRAAGVEAVVAHGPEKTHFTIIQEFGQPGDHIGAEMFAFFRKHDRPSK
jgi:acetyl esterase/lipase